MRHYWNRLWPILARQHWTAWSSISIAAGWLWMTSYFVEHEYVASRWELVGAGAVSLALFLLTGKVCREAGWDLVIKSHLQRRKREFLKWRALRTLRAQEVAERRRIAELLANPYHLRYLETVVGPTVPFKKKPSKKHQAPK